MTDFFILPEKLEDDFLLHAIVKRGGRYYTCYITMGGATIDHIPPEIFRNNIFKYLSPQDLFSLGESSSQMKNIVLENVKHSEAVHLQYLKTRKRHYLMEVSSFDDVAEIPYSNLCPGKSCVCRKFHKRGPWVVLDPLNCLGCLVETNRKSHVLSINIFKHCLEHDVLISGMLSLKNCIECKNKNDFCFNCAAELDM